MKTLFGAAAFLVLGAGAADAATFSIAGEFNVNSLLSLVQVTAVPEPLTWGAMILGFALLALRVRALSKTKVKS